MEAMEKHEKRAGNSQRQKTETVRKGKVSLWGLLAEMSGGASSPLLDINPPLFRSLSLCNSEDA